MTHYDVVVVGAGPAGATAAALVAQAGFATLIIERAHFPRDKVCGDCVNPGCWEVFRELAVDEAVRRLPHSRPRWVDFAGSNGSVRRVNIPAAECGEIAVRRSDLDQVLLNRALELGAELWAGEPVTTVQPQWEIATRKSRVQAKYLIAADGRNSSVARLLGHAPRSRRDRVALQTHFNWQAEPEIGLELHSFGYLGRAMVSEETMNLCLVCRPAKVAEARSWAQHNFNLAKDHAWLSVAPLSRAPIRSRMPRLFYVGDAGHVVEPFTGEGIFYALNTGRLAAGAIVEEHSGGSLADTCFRRGLARVYRGRLWVNQLAKHAMLHRLLGDALIQGFQYCPLPLEHLTLQVLGLRRPEQSASAEALSR